MDLEIKAFSELDLEDTFFDSLKNSYPEFTNWFRKKAINGESAYVFFDEYGKILDFLYLKNEEESMDDVVPRLPSKKRLKVGTFKIKPRHTRRGERFMKKIMDRGVYLEFDNFGKEYPIPCAYGRFPTDAERMEVFYELIDAGYANNILVSCDICLKKLLVTHEGPGYAHFVTKIADMIREKYENAEEILETVLVKNPAKYLDNPKLDA